MEDYRPSIDLIRKFIDSRALGGYAASENGRLAGYGFYVVEDHKGLIGGLFASSEFAQQPVTERLLTEMLSALRATPRLQRIEAQLMPFGCDLDYLRFRLPQVFPSTPCAPVHAAAASGRRKCAASHSFPPGCAWSPGADRAFDSAAKLIHLAYADHVDGQINDQLHRRAIRAALKFLRNIVLLPGLRAVPARRLRFWMPAC